MSNASIITEPTKFWALPESRIYSSLETSAQGISQLEADRRLKIHGYNELPTHAFSLIQVLFRQLKNPIFAILVACAVIAGWLGEIDQSIAILAMIGISVVLGFYNEYKAEKVVEQLQRNVSIKATVMRDGKLTQVDSRLLVVGDLVSVYIGDIVPADLRILNFKDLQIDEATFTGESFPVDKNADALNIEHPMPQELTNSLFMGTVVVHGSGQGVVVATAKKSELGAISGSLARSHPETKFQIGIRQYGGLLLKFTIALTLVIFSLMVFVSHKPIADALIFSLAVAVGLVPELMPAIVTICLAHGASIMAKEQVIVKRLVSIEDFGNMEVLCTDKTGTLTEGKIIVKDYLSLIGDQDPKILTYSLLCNNAFADGELVKGNPIDVAIWEHALENGQGEEFSSYTLIDDIPFDYQRRLMSVVVQQSEVFTLISKGAPESIFPRCISAEISGVIMPIEEVLESVQNKFETLSEEGYRILAVAYRSVDAKKSYTGEEERELTLLGFLVFTDPVKQDAGQAIAKLKEMGVDVKILTGDNEIVARKICEELSIPVTQVLTGANVVDFSWSDFKAAVEETTIFARVTPEQKLDIIRALKENKHVVGFMGDGVNDAPALYEADVGISVDTAVDVARSAADIVLLQKDLLVLASGINEGRKVFGNTIKYVLMGTSSNFGNMFSVAAGAVFLPFLPMLPMQILFMNLLYDSSNMTIPTDNVDAEYIRKPNHWDINFIKKFTLFFGPFSSIYDFLTFGIMLFMFHANTLATQAIFQSAWFIESFWTEVLVMFVIRTRRTPFFTSKPGKWLALLTLSFVAFGTVLPFTSIGNFLGLVPLPATFWLVCILMTITYLVLVDAAKVFFYKMCKY